MTKNHLTQDVSGNVDIGRLRNHNLGCSVGMTDVTEMTGYLWSFSLHCLSSCRTLAWTCSSGCGKFPSSKRGKTPLLLFNPLLMLFSYVPLVKARSMPQPRLKGQRNRLRFLMGGAANHCGFSKNLPHRVDTLLTETHSAKLPSQKTVPIYSPNSCLYFILSHILLNWC